MKEAQSFAVKRAEVEFHNFASLGQPERAMAHYANQNVVRGKLIGNHAAFIGHLSPFAEIGSNVGHTSYMLANEFGAEGFALDISADALRYGVSLMDRWQLSRAPVRVAGDAANLPFADNSLRFVMAFQMLSQFMDIERVFIEVKRVLMPGGVFLFAEEPLRRLLTLRLYRCPYYDTMKPWERKLFDWGLLGYLVRDVIGALQEESFGIRQNHTMGLKDWHALIRKHFVAHEYEMLVPERGWGERIAKRLAVKLDPHASEWRAARLLGGTLAAVCRKAGETPPSENTMERFEQRLRCPDCHGPLRRDEDDTLRCAKCGYEAANEGSVYNLLPSKERKELYPGRRADVIDFSQAGHEEQLQSGFYDLEGVFGNKYRWMAEKAVAWLKPIDSGPHRLRVRGHVHERSLEAAGTVHIEIAVNGARVGHWSLDRTGLFIVEADVPDAAEYNVLIHASPAWRTPGDDRNLTVNLSMIRLIPRE